jgi:hypothetical protein
MWEENLVHGMTWTVSSDYLRRIATTPPQPLKRSKLNRLPSWSWFRYQVPISMPATAVRSNNPIKVYTKICSLEVEWTGTPLTSEIKFARLVVEGLLQDLTIRNRRVVEDNNGNEIGWYDPDGQLDPRREILKAPCLAMVAYRGLQCCGYFLVLRKVDHLHEAKFGRIGVGW